MSILKRTLRILEAKWNNLGENEDQIDLGKDSQQEFADFDRKYASKDTPKKTAIEAKEEFYKILEVKPGAKWEEIRSSYLKLCKKYHPDRFSHDLEKQELANRLLAEINKAYEYFEKKRI